LAEVLAKAAKWGAAFAAALLCALLLAPAPAAAAISSCSISSAGIAFSAYNSQTKAAVDGVGTIVVTCSGDGASNSLSLNLTGGSTGSCSSRQMRSGTNALSYQIYQDSGRASAFCDAGNRLDINMDFTTGTSQTRTYTMYGRVTSGQNPVYGASFTDQLTVALKRGGSTIASSTATMTSSVAAICTVTAGTLGFGAYNGTAAALAAASVSVNCSSGAAYQVGLDAGVNASGTTRRMAGPAAARLSYELYSNSVRTLAWGDGSALGARVAGTGSGSAQSLTVYGRIPAGQLVAAGSYTDSVVVTVEY
jgi:spore coat protein U-like protein